MTTIKLKNGSGAPTSGDLVQGEPALDLTNKRLYTEDSGGTVIEVGTNPGTDVTFADNRKAVFGAGSDLQIYHDGSDSYITDTTGGNFFINDDGSGYLMMKGSDLYFRNESNVDMIHASSDSFVKLYHNGAEKLATGSSGIDVTGTVTADNVDISGTAGIGGVLTANAGVVVDNFTIDGAEIDCSADMTLDVAGDLTLDVSGGDVRIKADGTQEMQFKITDGANVDIISTVADDDIRLRGNDGGATITALTLDMSAAGAAIFNAGATFGSGIDVTGTVTIKANSGSNSHVFTYNENGGEIQIYDDAGSVATLIDQASNNTRILELINGSNMQLGLGGSNTTGSVIFVSAGNSEAARFDPSGNLLVGTTSSSTTSGAGLKLTKPTTSGNDDGKLAITGGTSTSAQDAFQIYSTGASAYRCFINYAGSIYATSTSITAISDESLKENIRDLDKGLDTVLALQPRRFDWKNGDGNDIMGFVAQEVEEVMPELVHDYKYSETETKLGLKMGDMVPTLVKAVQDQQEIIENLKSRIEQLEGAN